MDSEGRPTRRRFLARAGSCAAHLALLSAGAPALGSAFRAAAAIPDGRVVARAPWGRVESVGPGVWALVSTPLEDPTTLCNGGIVAGRAGVVLVEGYASDAGLRWMVEQARELTGRRPTHLVLTHYHGDHTGGLGEAGRTGDLRILATAPTRDRIRERNTDPPEEVLAGVETLDTRRPTEIDLGDRTVLVVPRRGHTASDVTVEVVDPPVVFCGDLVWNRMFPNYMDARPSRLSRAVGLLRAREARIWVPGHGPVAGRRELDAYLELLGHVEEAARTAVDAGWSAAEAARRFTLPPALAEWTFFSPRYPEVALEAWMDELSPGG